MAEILSRADSSNGAGDISRGIGKPGNRGTGEGRMGQAKVFALPLSLFPFYPLHLFSVDHDTCARSRAAIAGFGCAPTIRSTSFPFLKMSIVGIL